MSQRERRGGGDRRRQRRNSFQVGAGTNRRKTNRRRQLPMDFEPPSSRADDRSTSVKAAFDAGFRASRGRVLVLVNLQRHGALTDYELADITRWQQNSIGKRRLECMRAGLVEQALDEGGAEIQRPAPSGSMSLAWKLTPLGERYIDVFNITVDST